jgi:hypothetical protein
MAGQVELITRVLAAQVIIKRKPLRGSYEVLPDRPHYTQTMTTKLQEVIAIRTEQAAAKLAAVARRCPAERLTWKPAPEARDVMELLRECAVVNVRSMEAIRTGHWSDLPGLEERYAVELDTLDKAIDRLLMDTRRLIDVVRAVPAERFDEDALLDAICHMSYHEGQVNYIQTLYGDLEYYS